MRSEVHSPGPRRSRCHQEGPQDCGKGVPSMGNSRGQGPEVGAWERDRERRPHLPGFPRSRVQSEGWARLLLLPHPSGRRGGGQVNGHVMSSWRSPAGGCWGQLSEGSRPLHPSPAEENDRNPKGTLTPTMCRAEQPGPAPAIPLPSGRTLGRTQGLCAPVSSEVTTAARGLRLL